MEIINGDPKLYSMVLDTIRIVFQSSPFPSLCSIRVDLLMNYHEKDNTAVSISFKNKFRSRRNIIYILIGKYHISFHLFIQDNQYG